MFNKDELLSKLMDISPVIEENINTMENIKDGVEGAGDKTINDYISDCIDTLLTLLTEQGINFHIEEHELLTDFYNTQFLILLYQLFIPENLISLLHNDQKLFKNISSKLDGLSDHEYIVHILQAYSENEQSQSSRDMYVYLYDKINNNELYAIAIRDGLKDVEFYHQVRSLPVIDNDAIKFIEELLQEKVWFQKMLNKIIDLKIDFDYSEAYSFIERFRSEFNTNDNLAVFSTYRQQVKNSQDIINKIVSKTRKNSIYYPEHYSQERFYSLPVTKLIVMILAQLSDHHLFGIEPKFKVFEDSTTFDFRSLIPKIKQADQVVRAGS